MTAETVTLRPPPYERHDYEVDLAVRETLQLLRPREITTQADGSLVAHGAKHPSHAPRLTFFHSWASGTEPAKPTWQALSEGPGRKNSTYSAHGMHTYRGKFYPQLARVLLHLSGVEEGSRVLDPFGGSGTTATEAVLLGAEAVSLDWNPLAVEIARAKIDCIDVPPSLLADAVESWSRSARSAESTEWAQFPEQVRDELVSWFPHPVLARLSHLLAAIRSHPDTRLVRVGEVLVSDLLRDVSHQAPGDLRVRRRATPLDDADVEQLFRRRCERLVASLQGFAARRALGSLPTIGQGHVVSVDVTSRQDDHAGSCLAPGSVDAVVTSPPYATALPYLDTDRLSLALILGYASRDRRALENRLVGSREIGVKQFRELRKSIHGPDDLLPTSTIDFLQYLDSAAQADPNAGFRRQQKPAALYRYFSSMARALDRIRTVLRPGGSAWLVVGDSRTTLDGQKIRIPTTDELAAIAKHLGFAVEELVPITVSKDGLLHARNRITENAIIHLRV